MKPTLRLDDLQDTYFTLNKCNSYNLFWNELVGGRGVGKTTRLLIYGMNNYIKHLEEFIYIRRYKNETKEFIANKTIEKLYDGVYIKGTGSGESYIVYNEDMVCGHIMTLASQAKYKSSDFSNVTTIIFDEVFIQKSRTYYLPNEVIHLLQLISTVQRTRTNLRVFILSNNNSTFNPYHTFFEIPDFKYVWTNKERGIYCEKIPINPKLLEKEMVTPLFKLTANTAYGQYHYANEVLRSTQIEEEPNKPNGAYYYITIIANNEPLTLFMIPNRKETEMWVSNCYVPGKEKYTYEIFKDDKIVPYYAKAFKVKFLGMIEKMMAHNRVHFENAKCYDILAFILQIIK